MAIRQYGLSQVSHSSEISHQSQLLFAGLALVDVGGVRLAPASLLHNFKDNGLKVPTAVSTHARLMILMLTTGVCWHDCMQEKGTSKLSESEARQHSIWHYCTVLAMKIRKMLVIENYMQYILSSSGEAFPDFPLFLLFSIHCAHLPVPAVL